MSSQQQQQQNPSPEAVVGMLGRMLGADLIAALQEAFLTGDFGGVVHVLGTSTNAQVRAGKQAAFHEACAAGDTDGMGLALAFGGVRTSPAPGQACVLWRAVEQGQTDVVRVLAESGQVDVNHAGPGGATALWKAATNGDATCIGVLLAAKDIDVNRGADNGCTPLYAACARGHGACVRLLLAAAGTNQNQARGTGFTPLFAACQRGHAACVRLLLAAKGTDQNQAKSNSTTPLHIACARGHGACVQLLLEAEGTDQNRPNGNGATPFFMACQNGHKVCVRLLLAAASADQNQAKGNGCTPLFVACQQGHEACARLLLAAKGTNANLSLVAGGWTPLHKACSGEGNPAMAALVLAGGGNRFTKNMDGRTALELTTSTAIREVFHQGIDYWQRRRHAQHAHAMRQVVLALLLARQRLGTAALPAPALAPAHVRATRASRQRQQPTRALLVHLPEEIWLLVCTFLRSADFGP